LLPAPRFLLLAFPFPLLASRFSVFPVFPIHDSPSLSPPHSVLSPQSSVLLPLSFSFFLFTIHRPYPLPTQSSVLSPQSCSLCLSRFSYSRFTVPIPSPLSPQSSVLLPLTTDANYDRSFGQNHEKKPLSL